MNTKKITIIIIIIVVVVVLFFLVFLFLLPLLLLLLPFLLLLLPFSFSSSLPPHRLVGPVAKPPASRTADLSSIPLSPWISETIISWEEKPKKVVFLTDSLSALQALMSGEPDTTQKKLTENTSTLAQTTCVVLQWIPAHTAIRGNENCRSARKRRKGKGATPITCVLQRSQNSSIINRKPSSTGGYNPNQDSLHQLPRHQQTIIFRLRTGHCRLNSHLKRIGI